MGEKGKHVVIDPQLLIPAVTFIRMGNKEMEGQVMALSAASKEALNSGWWRGQRLEGQAECAEAVVNGCNALNELFRDLAPASQGVYEKFLNAETRAAIDQQVAAATEKVATKANRGALRKK